MSEVSCVTDMTTNTMISTVAVSHGAPGVNPIYKDYRNPKHLITKIRSESGVYLKNGAKLERRRMEYLAKSIQENSTTPHGNDASPRHGAVGIHGMEDHNEFVQDWIQQFGSIEKCARYLRMIGPPPHLRVRRLIWGLPLYRSLFPN